MQAGKFIKTYRVIAIQQIFPLKTNKISYGLDGFEGIKKQ